MRDEKGERESEREIRLCCDTTHFNMTDTMVNTNKRDLPEETESPSCDSTRPQRTAHSRPLGVTYHIEVLRFDSSFIDCLNNRERSDEGATTVRIKPTT
jgi:hypothetical protein